MSKKKKSRARILCVDDEKNILEGMSFQLGRRCEVTTALNAPEGLDKLKHNPPFEVVISDMRMPGMDGATFLTQVRELYPDTVRMLLTGQTGLDAAIQAVNQGQIFRFLTKPCPRDSLMTAVEAAIEQHRLISSERVLLQSTLRGSIKALVNLVELTQPAAIGKAGRLQQLAGDLADAMQLENRWQVEVAALLFHVGLITLPPELTAKYHEGHPLTEDETRQVEGIPKVAQRIIRDIPRMEEIEQILTGCLGGSSSGVRDQVRVLRSVVELDRLTWAGHGAASALSVLRQRDDMDPAVIDALSELCGDEGDSEADEETREISLSSLVEGMIFTRDVMTRTGALLIARGYEVTPELLERMERFQPGWVVEPVSVKLPGAEDAEEAETEAAVTADAGEA
ncbi:hypothetical protein ABI59_18280 [Acidobacteria bacterium Mor1]|nr:hypothetical protein ABI59_18280 [Acidobacteria bacterium Mor1]